MQRSRTIAMYWLGHLLATVAGWYVLGAVAQGVVDGSGDAPLFLTLLNIIIQILCFPLVLSALAFAPMQVGTFTIAGFCWLLAAAALNSALVVGLVAVTVGAVRTRLRTR